MKLSTSITFSQAIEAASAILESGATPFFLGPPGVGKTSLGRALAKHLKLPLEVLVLSHYDSTDIAGFPFLNQDGDLDRKLFGIFRRAAAEPTLILLDEITCIQRSVEGPALRLALERVAGEVALHKDSRIVMAGNDPEEAPGGHPLSAAMTNRVIMLSMIPSLEELRSFFDQVEPPSSIVDPRQREAICTEFADFAATLAVKPSLIQCIPGADSIDNGAPWPSPRAWELGLRAYALMRLKSTVQEGIKDKDSKTGDRLGYAVLSGAVGDLAAGAYLTMKHLRHSLPTVEEIIRAPRTAKLPYKADEGIAVLGLLMHVMKRDVTAAHLYTHRLEDLSDVLVAASILLMKNTKPGDTDIATFLKTINLSKQHMEGSRGKMACLEAFDETTVNQIKNWDGKVQAGAA